MRASRLDIIEDSGTRLDSTIPGSAAVRRPVHRAADALFGLVVAVVPSASADRGTLRRDERALIEAVLSRREVIRERHRVEELRVDFERIVRVLERYFTISVQTSSGMVPAASRTGRIPSREEPPSRRRAKAARPALRSGEGTGGCRHP